MSWETVSAAIMFYDVGAGQTWTTERVHPVTDVSEGAQVLILSYLQEVYSGSQTARDFLELFAASGMPIRIGIAANGEAAFGLSGPGGYVGVDLAKIPLTYYMNDHGVMVQDKPAITILHELQHTFWNAQDPGFLSGQYLGVDLVEALENTADYDHNGPPVNFTNAVAREMGWVNSVQSSYATGMAGYTQAVIELRPFLLTEGHSYTNGETVAITRFGDPISNTNRHDDLDQSARGDSSDLLMGFGGNDVLDGGGGRDFLYGGSGDDILIGGGGDDEIWGGMETVAGREDGLDTVRYSAALAGISFRIGSSITVQDGEGGTDTLHSIERIEGSAYGDTLVITSLTSDVGAAFDWIDLGSGADTIDISGLEGSATVNLTDSANQTVTLGGAVLHLRNVENVTGAGGDDRVYASASVGNTITGGAGDDTFYLAGSGHSIRGGDGYDQLDLSTVVAGSRIAVDSGSALIYGSGESTFSSIEEIVAGGGSNMMFGDGSGITLVGGSGNNYLQGWGSDILRSGSGDTYFSVNDGATVISGAGSDYIEAAGSAPITIEFGEGSGHDMLGSYFSSDSDTSWVDERQKDLVVLEGLTKSDIELVWDYTAIDYFDYLYDDDPSSQLLNDWHQLTGDAAIRIIETGETLYLGQISYYYTITGAMAYLDTLSSDIWEPTDRTVSYDWDWISEQAGLNAIFNTTAEYGTRNDWSSGQLCSDNTTDWDDDTVDFDIFSFDGVEKLSLFDLFDLQEIVSQPLPTNATSAQDLLDRIGDAGDTRLVTGSSAADNLTGSSGNDDILAGAGDDIADGGAGDDYIRGGGGNDVLAGGLGNDNIDGDDGHDSLSGGAGNDIYIVRDSTDEVQEIAGEGIDEVRASVTLTLPANVEILTLTGSDEIEGYGNEISNVLNGNSADNRLYGLDGADQLNGNAGDDWLDGGNGVDRMYGGSGDDIYVFSEVTDSAHENVNEGLDRVFASFTIELGANVENLTLTGTDTIQGLGNELANLIVGNAAANKLYGYDSDDRLIGGAGLDTLIGGAGSDRLEGGAEHDKLYGGDGADVLWGNDFADQIEGGAGRDRAYGGLGADNFQFREGDLAGVTTSTCDQIHDFSQAEGDRIRLTLVDADMTTDGDQAFAFVGADAFHGVAGELRYEQISGNTYVQGDTDGDGIADFWIRLDGLHALTSGDIIF
jgi:Ca2+-binding RTX toxin-like protein